MDTESCSYSLPRQISEDERKKLEEQQEMADFKRRKLEVEARKNWERFYKRNQDKFFRDRHWTREEMSEIFSDVDLKPLVFLEAGCGVGNMLFPLTEYFPNWRFFGFDFSANGVEVVRQRAKDQGIEVGVDVLDLTEDRKLDFPSADLATLIFVLSAIHPEKHEVAVQTLSRHLKPGSSVFVRDYGAFDSAMIRFGRGAKIADRFYARQDGTRAFYFFKEELVELFVRNGFTVNFCDYIHKTTTNYEKEMSVPRVFVQGRFVFGG